MQCLWDRSCLLAFSLVVALLPSIWITGPAQAQSSDQFYYYVLVDVSGSMVGKPNNTNTNIFPEVKNSIAAFIRSVRDDSSVSILPFHERIDQPRTAVIRSDGDRSRLVDYVRGLEAHGQTTWIYHSLRDAIERVREDVSADADRAIVTLLLYTDGLNEGPDDLDLDGLLREFSLVRGEVDNLFLKYITLGVDLPASDQDRLSQTDGISVINNPAGVVQPVLPVEIAPSVLDFGSLADGSQVERSIRLNFPDDARGKSLSLRVKADCVESEGGLLVLDPETIILGSQEVTLTAQLLNPESVGGRRCEATVSVLGDESLLVRPDQLVARFVTADLPEISVTSPEGGPVGHSWDLSTEGSDWSNEKVWQIRIQRSGGVGDETIPISLTTRRESSDFDVPLEMRIPGQPWSKSLDLIISDAPLLVDVRFPELPRVTHDGQGRYLLEFRSDSAEVTGDGVEQDVSNPSLYVISYDLNVDVPFSWPSWVGPAIWILGGVILIILLVWFVCAVMTPRFVAGAELQADDGTTVRLTSRCLKRWYTMGGFGADFVLPGAPGMPMARISPSGPDVLIVPLPEATDQIKDAGGYPVDEHGTALADGDSVTLETVTVHYRIHVSP